MGLYKRSETLRFSSKRETPRKIRNTLLRPDLAQEMPTAVAAPDCGLELNASRRPEMVNFGNRPCQPCVEAESGGSKKQCPFCSECPQVSVDSLPDEMLLLIFSKVQHGPTLLDSVPLVCKRWCRLARDPASWAGVELTVANHRRATRVLLHAPAAKSLTIDPSLHPFPLPGHMVASALRRSRIVVPALAILEGGRPEPEEEGLNSAIVGFLSRQRGALRELRLHLRHHDHCEEAATLRAVAKLRHLTKLEIVAAPGVVYKRELRGRLPELRQVTVRGTCPRVDTDSRLPRGLVGDLVRGARALRVLDLDMPVGADRRACAALRGLEHAALNAFQDAAGHPRPVQGAAVSAVRAALELLLAMATPALRTAVVSLCRGEHAGYSFRRKRRCRDLLKEFSLLMPHVGIELDIDGPGCEACRRPNLTGYPYSPCPGQGWPVSDPEHSDPGEDNDPGEGNDPAEVNDPGEGNDPGEDNDPGKGNDPGEVNDPGEDSDPGEQSDREEESDKEGSRVSFLSEPGGYCDSEPDLLFGPVPADFCDSDCDCSLCSSKADSSESASESDPDMYYSPYL